VVRFFEVTKTKPAYGQGFRGAIVWAACLLVGFHTDQILLGLQAGFVGWIVSFCDDSTGASRRLIGASVLTLVAGGAAFVATLFSSSILGAVVVTAALGTLACLASLGGPAGAKKGLVVMFLALFAVGTPADLATATELMVASIVGGFATMIVIALSLPFGRSRNPLMTAAKYYAQCGDLARLYSQDASAVAISQARATFIGARQEAYLDLRYTEPTHRKNELADYLGRGANLIKSVETFHDARRGRELPPTESTLAMYGAISDLFERASQALASPGLHDVGVQRTLDSIDKVTSEVLAQPSEAHAGLAILRHMRTAVASLLDDPDTNAAQHVGAALGPTLRERAVVSLRFDTPLRRHLLRFVVLMSLATALYKWLAIPDGYFIPIGINIMLQQDLGGSISRLRAYALGTIAGSAIGAILGVTLDSFPIGLTIATSITLFVMISFSRVTWWAFAVGASVFIVSALGLLVEGGFYLGVWRVADTLIAAVFVAIGMFALWPTRVRKLAPTYIAECLTSTADYLRAATGGDEELSIDRRRAVVRSSAVLSQRINEYAREPGHSAELLAQLQNILIQIQVMYGLVTEISKSDQHSRDTTGVGVAVDLGPTRDSVVANLQAVADAFRANQAVTRLPDIVTLPTETPNRTSGQEMVSVGVLVQSMAAHTPVRITNAASAVAQ
jgi:uncharacterized membrane protein YccC